MSPASAGPLEVERYIGACLISSQGRHKKNGASTVREQFGYNSLETRYHHHQQQQQHHQRSNGQAGDRWAGGLPLISFAGNQQQQRWRSPPTTATHGDNNSGNNRLARLAVHTHGAPLILANNNNRYGHRKSKGAKQRVDGGGGATAKKAEQLSLINGCDAISVASDESSSGSNQSDAACVLPRIIKPRKRRKKDRKPPPLAPLVIPLATTTSAHQDASRSFRRSSSLSESGGSSSSVGSPDAIAFVPFVPYGFDARLPCNRGDNDDDNLINSVPDSASETPQLHHAFEDVVVRDLSNDGGAEDDASSCQCRYCDPCGQIWDVGRGRFSPRLTRDSRRFFAGDDEAIANATETLDNYLSLLNGIASFTFDDDDEPEDVAVNGAQSANNTSFGVDLEVSTEIVTFLKGHRDLEIKFYTTPATAPSTSAR